MKSIFYGSCVAMVTPFKHNTVDYDSFLRLINRQIENGTSAILVLGTTGEGSTINERERIEIIKFAREHTPKNIPLIVGCGTNDTNTSLQRVLQAQSLGADGALVVTPYYNKTTQAGLVAHYTTICALSNLPIIVYNVPSRTGLNIEPDTMQKIASLKNVVGLKEANSNISHILQMFHVLKTSIAIYSGNDDLNYIFYALGGAGTISVTANVLPREIASQFTDAKTGLKVHKKLYALNKVLFCEVNPTPVKCALQILDLCQEEVRLPLVNVTDKNENKIKKILNQLKINY